MVLPKVQHSPETLYVPTEVNTLQVDGLPVACISGLMQAICKSHSQSLNTVPVSPTSDAPKVQPGWKKGKGETHEQLGS